MRKGYSIGFYIVIVLIVAMFIFAFRLSYHKALAEMEEEKLEQLVEDLDDFYYVKSADGYVTVYFADKATVYEYTSIPISELPRNIQNELKTGKKLNNLKQVYGFLENYSS